MINFTFARTGNIGTLTFYGELGHKHVNELKAALMISLNNADHLVVNLVDVTRIDPSCLHSIASARRMSSGLHKRLTFTGIRDGIFDQTIPDEGAGHTDCIGNR